MQNIVFYFGPPVHFFVSFEYSLWNAVNIYGSPVEGDLLTTGTPLSSPPLIDLLSNDPILRGVKVLTLDANLSFDICGLEFGLLWRNFVIIFSQIFCYHCYY